MVSILIFGADPAEGRTLKNELQRLTALETDEEVSFCMLRDPEQLNCVIRETAFFNMALVDVTFPAGIAAAEMVRAAYPDVQILVMASTRVSPVRYLRPAVRPAALLLRPYGKDVFRSTVRDFFMLAMQPVMEQGGTYFWARTRCGTEKIPYNAIIYFEAREKHIYVRTRTTEYGTGGTLEKLAGRLPVFFIRCHRSYIINRDFIETVRLKEGIAGLEGGMVVPVSRNYRRKLKEFIGAGLSGR